MPKIQFTDTDLTSLVHQFKLLAIQIEAEMNNEDICQSIYNLFESIYALHHYAEDSKTTMAHYQTVDDEIRKLEASRFTHGEAKTEAKESLTSKITDLTAEARNIMKHLDPFLGYSERLEILKAQEISALFSHPYKTKAHVMKETYLDLLNPLFQLDAKIYQKYPPIRKDLIKEWKTLHIHKQLIQANPKTKNTLVEIRKNIQIIISLFNEISRYDEASNQIITLVTHLKEASSIQKILSIIEKIDDRLLYIISCLPLFASFEICEPMDHEIITNIRRQWKKIVSNPSLLAESTENMFKQLIKKTPYGYYVHHLREHYANDTDRVEEKEDFHITYYYFSKLMEDKAISDTDKSKLIFYWESIKTASQLDVIAMLLSDEEFDFFQKERQAKLSNPLPSLVRSKASLYPVKPGAHPTLTIVEPPSPVFKP